MHLSPFVSVRIYTHIYMHTMPNCVSRANAARTTLSIERSFAFYFTHYAVYDGLLILIVFLIRLFFCCNEERRFLGIFWDVGLRKIHDQKWLDIGIIILILSDQKLSLNTLIKNGEKERKRRKLSELTLSNRSMMIWLNIKNSFRTSYHTVWKS